MRKPLPRSITAVVRCKPDDKAEKEKDVLVKDAVEQLRKADIDQAAAREMMKMWKEVRSFRAC